MYFEKMILSKDQPDSSLQSIILENMCDGEIAVYDFLNLVLYHPEFGYYAKNRVIGRGGDFITSPEISQLFGEIIAIYILHDWNEKGKPQKIHLVELGPGRGALLIDLLNVFKKYPDFMDALHISLIEKSDAFKSLQKELLESWSNKNHYALKVKHFSDICDISSQGYLYCYANEFFDALPIRQYYTDHFNQRIERTVYFKNQTQAFEFCDDANIEIEEEDDETIKIAQFLKHIIERDGGRCIFFDYGYIQGSSISTLQTVYRHQKVNVFDYLGDADISHQINFSNFAKAFSPLETKIMTQANFLEEWGILLRLQQLSQTNPNRAHELSIQVSRLISKTMMGEHFKVLLV